MGRGKDRHSLHKPTNTPVIFGALMLLCLCHRVACSPTSLQTYLSLYQSTAEQRGTVKVSAELALSPTQWNPVKGTVSFNIDFFELYNVL